MAACTWQHARGSMHVAACTWQHAHGSMHVAACTWQHARGSMHMAKYAITSGLQGLNKGRYNSLQEVNSAGAIKDAELSGREGQSYKGGKGRVIREGGAEL